MNIISGDQDKWWAPHICRTVCYSELTHGWMENGRYGFFPLPMVWQEPTNRISDCYFWKSNINGFSKKTNAKIVHADCRSVLNPVRYDIKNPDPVFLLHDSFDDLDTHLLVAMIPLLHSCGFLPIHKGKPIHCTAMKLQKYGILVRLEKPWQQQSIIQ